MGNGVTIHIDTTDMKVRKKRRTPPENATVSKADSAPPRCPRSEACPMKDGRMDECKASDCPMRKPAMHGEHAKALHRWQREWETLLKSRETPCPFEVTAQFTDLTRDQAQKATMRELLEGNTCQQLILKIEGKDPLTSFGFSLFPQRTLPFSLPSTGSIPSLAREEGPCIAVPKWSFLLEAPARRLVKSASGSYTRFDRIDQGTARALWGCRSEAEFLFKGTLFKGVYRWTWKGGDPTGHLEYVPHATPSQTPLKTLLSRLSEESVGSILYLVSKRLERIEVKERLRELRPFTILKRDDERRYTLSVAYPANEVDAHGDTMTPEEIEKAAWEYMRKRRKVGLMHERGTDGAGDVVESYVWRLPDTEIHGEIVKTGSWLMGILWEPKAWERIKKGEIQGLSLQGMGRKA
jgi:hypothetical protein